MSRTVLDIKMELLSDAIFGSGYSIAGGEDISVCVDNRGYPYLKGSTLKGLLRESAENFVAWGEGNVNLQLLFGEEGWDAIDDDRRIQITSLELTQYPTDTSDCFSKRAFTSVEDGVAKDGSLRLASCVRAGLTFGGQIICSSEDVDFIKMALNGIQRIGTLRNRGFGHVRFSINPQKIQKTNQQIEACSCLGYSLNLILPVQITNSERSQDNTYETQGYISGSAVRGAIMSRLAQRDLIWFEENLQMLLSDNVRFLDAFPLPPKTSSDVAVIPSPMGFYENSAEKELESCLINGVFAEEKKRAKLGSFCKLKDNTIQYWSSKIEGATRIKKKNDVMDKQVFQTSYLSAGQTLKGYILFSEQAQSLSTRIAQCFDEDLWLGADRYEGFGRCKTNVYITDCPSWITSYGLKETDSIETTLYMLAISPLALIGPTGEPCAMNDEVLSALFKTDVSLSLCATSVSEYSTYNRTWKCFSPTVRMYERGSVFKLEFKAAPDWEILNNIQKNGIGVRCAEGFGQVLFLHKDFFEKLSEKEKVAAEENGEGKTVLLRRQKMAWVENKTQAMRLQSMSSSQIGVVQALCESAIAKKGDTSEILSFIKKNKDKKADTREKFQWILDLLQEVVIDNSINLPLQNSESTVERLRLLCMLFDHQRKKGLN